MNFGLREKDLRIIRDIFSTARFVRGVKVFGSRAIDQFRRESDLDLAVIAPDATAEQWQNLREKLLEAPVVFDVDLLRIDNFIPNVLLEKVLRDGKDLFSEL